MPADALAPAIVTLLFAVGAVTAGFALLCRRDRFRIMWFDLAGSLTFIGVVLSVLIEPDQWSGSSPFRINLSNGTSLPQSDCVFFAACVQARAPLAVQANCDVGLDLQRSGPHVGD